MSLRMSEILGPTGAPAIVPVVPESTTNEIPGVLQDRDTQTGLEVQTNVETGQVRLSLKEPLILPVLGVLSVGLQLCTLAHDMLRAYEALALQNVESNEQVSSKPDAE